MHLCIFICCVCIWCAFLCESVSLRANKCAWVYRSINSNVEKKDLKPYPNVKIRKTGLYSIVKIIYIYIYTHM